MLLLSTSSGDWLAPFPRPAFIVCHEVVQGVAGADVLGELRECLDGKAEDLNGTLGLVFAAAASLVRRDFEFQPSPQRFGGGVEFGVALGLQHQPGTEVHAVNAAAVVVESQGGADGDQILSRSHQVGLEKELRRDARPFSRPEGEEREVFRQADLNHRRFRRVVIGHEGLVLGRRHQEAGFLRGTRAGKSLRQSQVGREGALGVENDDGLKTGEGVGARYRMNQNRLGIRLVVEARIERFRNGKPGSREGRCFRAGRLRRGLNRRKQFGHQSRVRSGD